MCGLARSQGNVGVGSELADHLVAGQIERVTVESTSDYVRSEGA